MIQTLGSQPNAMLEHISTHARKKQVVFRNLCHFSMIYKTGMTHE